MPGAQKAEPGPRSRSRGSPPVEAAGLPRRERRTLRPDQARRSPSEDARAHPTTGSPPVTHGTGAPTDTGTASRPARAVRRPAGAGGWGGEGVCEETPRAARGPVPRCPGNGCLARAAGGPTLGACALSFPPPPLPLTARRPLRPGGASARAGGVGPRLFSRRARAPPRPRPGKGGGRRERGGG